MKQKNQITEKYIQRKKTFRIVIRGRLTYYKKSANAKYWDEHWADYISQEYYIKTLSRLKHSLQADIFRKYLPRENPILEAGCGPAHWVIILRKFGYDVEGIDWSKKTIQKVLKIFPTLPIHFGDARFLPVEDEHYGGYISLGVIEHRKEGPELYISEAFRVLKPGGIAIFSVPWFNPIRRVKALLRCYDSTKKMENEKLQFYQYAFLTQEISKYLKNTGFKLLESKSSHNIIMGFEYEIPYIRKIYNIGIIGNILKRIIRKNLLLRKYFGHMRIFICEKPVGEIL